MSPVLDTTPLGTQAGILDRVLHAAHPRIELPTIAHNFGMSLAELQTIIKAHGYPDKDRMRLAMSKLLVASAQAIDPREGDGDLVDASETGPALGTLTRIPVGKLLADPDNPREHLTDIEELADSMREVGLLQPIVARRDGAKLYVVAGHRRLAAARMLRWTTVPVIVRAEMRPDHVLAAMLIENGQRADLDPIDEARGLNRLKIQLECNDGELARRIGRSQPFVSGRLALLSLSAAEQDQVRNGTMKLVEATSRGRTNSGNVRAKGQSKGWHLGPTHSLADRAKARCLDQGHSRGRTVGGMACGECWESVIRADERTAIHEHSVRRGTCAICDAPVQKAAV